MNSNFVNPNIILQQDSVLKLKKFNWKCINSDLTCGLKLYSTFGKFRICDQSEILQEFSVNVGKTNSHLFQSYSTGEKGIVLNGCNHFCL